MKRLLLNLVILVCMLSFGCNANQKSEYVGLKYEKIPKGLDYYGGWAVRGHYSVRNLAKDNLRMLWLEKVTNSKDKKKYYEVIDVLELPKIDKGYILSGPYCKINNVLDPTIIAIVKNDEEKEFLTEIKYAWKIEFKNETGKFTEMSTKGITCINQSYGI